MAFANAMDSRIIGENGAPSLATTGSKLLDLHTALVRGLSTSALEGLFAAALKEAITVEAKADIVILAFQTRAAREGKGERRLFHHELLRLIWSTLGEEAGAAGGSATAAGGAAGDVCNTHAHSHARARLVMRGGRPRAEPACRYVVHTC